VAENQKPLDAKKVFAQMDVVPENQCDGVMQRLVGTFESISCENQMSEVVTEPEKVVAGGPAN
jgi:hypothetical protein